MKKASTNYGFFYGGRKMGSIFWFPKTSFSPPQYKSKKNGDFQNGSL
jgi:hypothetical protein